MTVAKEATKEELVEWMIKLAADADADEAKHGRPPHLAGMPTHSELCALHIASIRADALR